MRALVLLLALAVGAIPNSGAVLGQREPVQPEPRLSEARRLAEAVDAASQPPQSIALGEPIPNRFVVIFKSSAGDAASASSRLARDVSAALESSVSAASAGDSSSFSLLGALGSAAADDGGGDVSAAAAAGGARTPPAGGLQGVVIEAGPAALQHIRHSSLVAAVFADRIVAPQADVCVQAQGLAQGVSATPSSSFKWDGCLTPRTKLVWIGQPCGSSSSGRVAYTELRAVSRTSNAVVRAKGKPCVLRPDPRNTTTWQRWNRQRFGSCGKAPTFAPVLPTTLCSAMPGSSPAPASPPPADATGAQRSPSPASPSPSPPSEPVVPSPAPPEQPTSPSPEPPSPEPSPEPLPSPSPQLPSPSPSPPPPQLVLPRVPLAGGELVPSGVRVIEAVADSAIASTLGLPLARQVVVGVLDSGVDATHPDINYVGGSSWATPASSVANDTASPDVDLFGHGTHVAGIVGARNNGAGVVGVAPGVPVYSLKALNGAGRGTLSSVISAIKWAASAGRALGIRVINVSLAAYVDPKGEEWGFSFGTICGAIQEASDAGILVVVAAGNYGSNIQGYLPASCPNVAVVTAMDGVAAGSFSNFLPTFNASAADMARFIAAPGVSIYSTISFARDASGYKTLSGTSMASPHVAGVAANCIMAGACSGSGTETLAVVQAAARERYAISRYGFRGDAMSTANFRYYGLLAWSKF